MLLHAHPSPVPVIESDRDDWWRQARCADPRDRDMWTSDHMGVRLAAAHQCIAHCPVLARCHKEAQNSVWRGCAVGGVLYDFEGEPLEVEPDPWKCGKCRPAMERRVDATVIHPMATLKLCERCGREFMADHPMRRQCRTEECERARWRESRRRGRAVVP